MTCRRELHTQAEGAWLDKFNLDGNLFPRYNVRA